MDAAVDQLMTWLAEADNHHVLVLGDPAYPADLLQMADPPLLLYVLGQLSALQHPLRLAIVGSRNPTPQGEANARQFAQALGESGVCVVSGLALGVDGAAHEGALESALRPSRWSAPGWTASTRNATWRWRTASLRKVPSSANTRSVHHRWRRTFRAATASSPAFRRARWWWRRRCSRAR
jgi:hypothetical protein